MKTTLTYSQPRTLKRITRLFFYSALVALSACQTIGDLGTTTVNGRTNAADIERQPAEILMSQGNYRGAADLWLELAKKTPEQQITQQDNYLLNAVSALLEIPDTEQAKQVLGSISQSSTPAWQINSAKLQLLLNKPTDTLSILLPLTTDNLDKKSLKQRLRLLAKAYNRLGNYFEAAQQRVILDALLDDALSQDSNHAKLWENLNQLSISALSSVHTATMPGHYRDWLELAILNKQAKQVGGSVQFAAWQRKHPFHPAVSRFLATLRNIEQSTTATPSQIALLLPLKGRVAEPARAIRDGFLAAYYQNKTYQESKTIKLYNVDASNVDAIYQQAITDGADFIVGPLTKDAVKQLRQKTTFTVPTLILNASDENSEPHSLLYQFSLLPEDEARQVAERIWLEGHSKGIIIYPESNWGERVGRAFQQHWQALGGQLVDSQSYSLASRDYAKPVREILNVDDSKKRLQRLKNLLGRKLEFETRRRQDIDFIFLAAFSEQARQIRPQLKFYDASAVPVYATSHVYSGNVNKQRDRDMNGIIFTDMPWTINNQQTKLKADISRLWQTRTEKLARFYAFGLDAFNLIPHLQRLQRYPFERYNGMTGSLRLDDNLRIIRQLSWAKFRAGKPKLEPIITDTKPFQVDIEKPIKSGFPKPDA